MGEMDEESRNALAERRALIEAQATALAADAMQRAEPWLGGQPPTDPNARRRWVVAIRTVAAYRDCYAIEGSTALGAAPASKAQKADAARARAAMRRAEAIAREAEAAEVARTPMGAEAPGIQ